MPTQSRKPALQAGCLITATLFSAYLAIATYPFYAWKFGAAFGTLAFMSIFLRVGWFVPFAIAGMYIGIFLNEGVKGGTIESQVQNMVASIVMGTVCGFAVGVVIDIIGRVGRRNDAPPKSE